MALRFSSNTTHLYYSYSLNFVLLILFLKFRPVVTVEMKAYETYSLVVLFVAKPCPPGSAKKRRSVVSLSVALVTVLPMRVTLGSP